MCSGLYSVYIVYISCIEYTFRIYIFYQIKNINSYTSLLVFDWVLSAKQRKVVKAIKNFLKKIKTKSINMLANVAEIILKKKKIKSISFVANEYKILSKDEEKELAEYKINYYITLKSNCRVI